MLKLIHSNLKTCQYYNNNFKVCSLCYYIYTPQEAGHVHMLLHGDFHTFLYALAESLFQSLPMVVYIQVSLKYSRNNRPSIFKSNSHVNV